MAFRHSRTTTGRRRPVLITTALAAVITLLTALVVTQPAFAAGSIGATFTSAGDWGTGHQVNVKVTNSGVRRPSNGWTLEFDLPAGRHHQQLVGRRRRPGREPLHGEEQELGRPARARAPRSRGATSATGPFKTPTACSINGVACTRWHPHQHADHARRRRHRRRPPTPTPTPTPTTTTAARRQEARRLLRRVGRLRPQLPREEHPDERLGLEADPHPLRVRQHHRRPVLDR